MKNKIKISQSWRSLAKLSFARASNISFIIIDGRYGKWTSGKMRKFLPNCILSKVIFKYVVDVNDRRLGKFEKKKGHRIKTR